MRIRYLEMVPIVPRLEVLARLLFMLDGNMAMFNWPTFRIRKVDVVSCHIVKSPRSHSISC